MRASIYVFVRSGWMNAMQSLLKSLLCEYKLNDLVAFKRLLPYLIPQNSVIIRNIQFTLITPLASDWIIYNLKAWPTHIIYKEYNQADRSKLEIEFNEGN